MHYEFHELCAFIGGSLVLLLVGFDSVQNGFGEWKYATIMWILVAMSYAWSSANYRRQRDEWMEVRR